MKKLTKKQFIQALHNSKGYFITSTWTRSMEEIQAALDRADKEKLPAVAIYHTTYEEMPTYLLARKDDGDTSRRTFDGHNEYWQYGEYILHVSKQEDSTCTMINY